MWHHCSARFKDKLEQLNKQALRVLLDDQSSTYEELLRKLHTVTLEQRGIQNMLVTVYKCLQGAAPSYLRTYLQARDAGFYDLRGYAKLKTPAVRTTRFGLHSFRHLAPNAWNKLLDTTRKADTLSMFKHKLKQFKTQWTNIEPYVFLFIYFQVLVSS